MPSYNAPVRDMKFLLHEVLSFDDLTKYDAYSEIDAELADAVIEQAAKFSEEVLAPLNTVGDHEGCTRHEDGSVTTPTGFKDAYKQMSENGWSALVMDPEYGGQGLSYWLQLILGEMNTYYCPGWSNYPGLTHGVRELVEKFGDDAQHAMFLPNLTTGSWSGTMCLTEPHCGTDLGLVNTAAKPNDDGSYDVTGTKIFITSSNIC